MRHGNFKVILTDKGTILALKLKGKRLKHDRYNRLIVYWSINYLQIGASAYPHINLSLPP
ncbi:hypothetical protein DYU05_13850 [Mucilaginibacter terrenus]|uniref:Uncharacterized protein n=1 Tax=Mucilaginibacter terrenus TaxID=2482727 RepID=A0A3E2NQR0_9SPHI|nr:hypothetical protein DYU05_13850 [Mucilaginibacter terrenus]